MSYYKFTTKQTTQQKNHLEALESKGADIFAIKELKKSINPLSSFNYGYKIDSLIPIKNWNIK